jgi:3-hydroxyacyl-[acyl-carrier-protein] dehydratase
MRWIWIDKFLELKSGSHAKSLKNVSMAEEHLHDHFPGFPVMPQSLMLEGMAQTGGILLGEKNNFKHVVVLAKVPNVIFHSWATPGDTIIYTVNLISDNDSGGKVECVGYVGDRLVVEAEIIFFHLDANDPSVAAVDQKNFVFTMNLMSVMDVGKAGDGD